MDIITNFQFTTRKTEAEENKVSVFKQVLETGFECRQSFHTTDAQSNANTKSVQSPSWEGGILVEGQVLN